MTIDAKKKDIKRKYYVHIIWIFSYEISYTYLSLHSNPYWPLNCKWRVINCYQLENHYKKNMESRVLVMYGLLCFFAGSVIWHFFWLEQSIVYSAIQQQQIESLTEQFGQNSLIVTDPQEYKTFDQLIEPEQRTHQFPLTQAWKNIIQQVRTDKTPTTIIPDRRDLEYLCAGYIYELSAELWTPLSAWHIWLQHPVRRDACDAREMPYCYRHKWWEISYDIWDMHWPHLKRRARDYSKLITQEDMIKLAAEVFHRDNILGDIWFLYYNSAYGRFLWTYGNYNTHITKNMWLSKFSVPITYTDPKASNSLLIRNALGCSEDMRQIMQPVFSRYSLDINGMLARYHLDGSLMKQNGSWHRSAYKLQPGDQLTYIDIALAHFFEWEQIDSFFQFSCRDIFYPINVININPKFVEKM